MNTKVIIYIILGLVVVYAVGSFFLKDMPSIGGSSNGGDSKSSNAPKNSQPTLAELKAKGYDDAEIAQIVASELYQKGEWNW